jgi:imidazole glycerol phosphate synthase subunit HisF
VAAVAVADAFHFNRITIPELRAAAACAGVPVRRV